MAALLFQQRVVDAPAEILGNVVFAAAGDHHPQISLEIEGMKAGGAIIQMAPDLHAPFLGELAVEKGVEPFDCLSAVDFVLLLPHIRLPSPTSLETDLRQRPASGDPTRPRSTAKSANVFWSAFLPLWILLITVPIGTSVMSAISL